MALLLTHSENALEVLGLVELGNVSGVEYVVDIFQHLLVDDLGIHKQERGDLGFDTCLHQAELKIVSPICHVVSLYDLDLIELIVAHECGQLTQGLTT